MLVIQILMNLSLVRYKPLPSTSPSLPSPSALVVDESSLKGDEQTGPPLTDEERKAKVQEYGNF